MLITFTRKTRGQKNEKVAEFEIDFCPSKGENVTICSLMDGRSESRIFRVMDVNTIYSLFNFKKGCPAMVSTSVEVFVE